MGMAWWGGALRCSRILGGRWGQKAQVGEPEVRETLGFLVCQLDGDLLEVEEE